MFVHRIIRSLPNLVDNLGRVLENILITFFVYSDKKYTVRSNKASTGLINLPFKTARTKIYFPGKGNSRKIKTSTTVVTFHCLILYITKSVTKRIKLESRILS